MVVLRRGRTVQLWYTELSPTPSPRAVFARFFFFLPCVQSRTSPRAGRRAPGAGARLRRRDRWQY